MDYRKSAEDVLKAIGGKDNVVSAAHCATRLRLVIADNKLVDKKKVEAAEGVKGCFEASGQLQIIYGTGTVNKVFDEFLPMTGLKEASTSEAKEAAAKKQNWFLRAIKTLGDIFVPIIPAIVASGLLNGILGGLSKAMPGIVDSSLYSIINLFAGAALSMLPILIAISAAKKFGGNQFLAAVIGFIMIHPSLINAWSVAEMVEQGQTIPTWDVWGGLWQIQQVGYQGHVIPVIIAIWFMSFLEKKLHKIVPEMLDLFVTPLVTVLVTGYLTLSIIGPVFSTVESWILTGAQTLVSLPYGIGGILIGGLYAITVVAGMHHMYNMIEAEMCSQAIPMNTWMPIATAANVAQGGAALAVGVKSKDEKIKSMALPASLSAFLGITEPAIFGVNIRYMTPFIAGLIGGAAGGFVASLTGVYANAYGITGLFGFLITTECTVAYAIVMVVAFIVSFVISFILYKDPVEDTVVEETEPKESTVREIAEDAQSAAAGMAAAGASAEKASEFTEETIYNPIKGSVIPMSEVPDETFAAGILGEGAAVVPEEGKIYAPADGEISLVFDTKHAISMTTDQEVEILIHCGINTVELNGEGFTTHVETGDRVKRGQLLMEFDMDLIAGRGYNLTTPVIIANTDEYKKISMLHDGPQDVGTELILVKGKNDE